MLKFGLFDHVDYNGKPLGEQLEARKFIERAKGVLMDECAMTENDAFSFIQRTAMSERTRMRDVAERILDGSLRPDTD